MQGPFPWPTKRGSCTPFTSWLVLSAASAGSVRVPSTWLWAAAHRDLLAKHPFRRLIPELPLTIRETRRGGPA